MLYRPFIERLTDQVHNLVNGGGLAALWPPAAFLLKLDADAIHVAGSFPYIRAPRSGGIRTTAIPRYSWH